MSRSLHFLILLFLFFGWNSAAHADRWTSLAISAERAQRLPDEIQLWSTALAEAAKKGTDSPCYSLSLRNLAYLYFNGSKDNEAAEKLFRRELVILEQIGKDYPDLAFDLYYLGRIDAMHGKMQSALDQYNRELQVCSGATAQADMVPDTLVNMMVPCEALGKVAEQKQCQTKLADGLIRMDKSWDLVVQRLIEYAKQVVADGDRAGGFTAPVFYKTAITLLTQAVQLSTKLPANLRNLQAQALTQRSIYWHLYFRDDRSALDDCLAAIPILEPYSLQGPYMVGFGDVLHQTAEYLVAVGRYQESLQFYKRSLAFLERNKKILPLDRWYRLYQIAAVQLLSDEPEESLQLLQKLKLEAKDDTQRNLALISMYSAYRIKGEKKQALNCLNQSRIICQKTEAKTRIALLLNLSDFYWNLGATAQAEDCLNAAMQLVEQVGKEDSASLAANLVLIGSRVCLPPARAVTYLDKAIALLEEKQPHKPSAELPNALMLRASRSLELTDYNQATQYYLKALALWRQFPNHEREQANTLDQLARIEAFQGHYQKGDDYCLESISIKQKLLERPSLIIRAQNLAMSRQYGKLEGICRPVIDSKEASDIEKELVEYWWLVGTLNAGKAGEALRLCDDEWLKKLCHKHEWKGCILNLKGRALSLAGLHDRAQTQLEEAVQILSPDLPAWWVRAEMANARFYQAEDFRAQTQPDRAEKYYSEALKLYSGCLITWIVDYRHECKRNFEQLKLSQQKPASPPMK